MHWLWQDEISHVQRWVNSAQLSFLHFLRAIWMHCCACSNQTAGKKYYWPYIKLCALLNWPAMWLCIVAPPLYEAFSAKLNLSWPWPLHAMYIWDFLSNPLQWRRVWRLQQAPRPHRRAGISCRQARLVASCLCLHCRWLKQNQRLKPKRKSKMASAYCCCSKMQAVMGLGGWWK